MKKFLVFIFFIITFSVNADEKKTTFSKEQFDKAQSDGKVVVVSSWIKLSRRKYSYYVKTCSLPE